METPFKDRIVFITGGANGIGKAQNIFIDGGMTKKMIYEK